MSKYHPTHPDDTPFNIPFKDGYGRDSLLREDERGPIVLRRIGLSWLFSYRPDPEQLADILAATGED